MSVTGGIIVIERGIAQRIMTDLHYSRVKIREATELLAIGEGKVKHRLMLAASRCLVFVDAAALPDDLRPSFESIQSRLAKKEPTYDGESRLQATLYRMHQSTAAKIAKDIWQLNLSLTERAQSPNWPTTPPNQAR
jgi:hypothetical protein